MNNIKMTKNSQLPLKRWESYKVLQKKVIEQEFSWTGLVVSCSIAFFVVVSSAFALGMICKSLERSIPEAKAEIRINMVDTVRKV